MRVISYQEVQEHRSAKSCWVVLYGHVWDVTSIVTTHPGGSEVILDLAGTDATQDYDPIHPSGMLEDTLPPTARLGSIDKATLPSVPQRHQSRASTAQQASIVTPQSYHEHPQTLEDCLNLDDIEHLATQQISRKAWAYYYSAGDDLHSKYLNNRVYSQILLRPRIFVDCTRCNTSTTLLSARHGLPSINVSLPVFVSPAAMARLAHSDGEAGIARACAKFGAAQIISNNASMKPEEIVAGAPAGQVFGSQLYVQDDRAKSEAMLARIAALPQIKFLVLTLDAPVPGKREHDERQKSVGASLPVRSSVKMKVDMQEGDSADLRSQSAKGGVGKALFAGTAADLTWSETLPWLAKYTTLPIVLKGVQTHEDAYIAAQHAPLIRGIVLSNHGGRALDTAPPAVHTLLEIRKYCPEVFDSIDVLVDGGIKRGTDVVKALALGAKAVGIGRAALYGLGAGGQAGVERVLDILKSESETAMRLLGCEEVTQLSLRHVNARCAEADIFDGSDGLRTAFMRSKL